MKRTFTATVSQEGPWLVAQALEADVASQGESANEALANLHEALKLHFEPPVPSSPPRIHRIEVEVPPTRSL